MNHVFIEYERPSEGVIKMRLTSDYMHECTYDAVYHDKLKELSWCYDTSKGEVYAYDPTMTVPKLIGVKSPRVYLWKYVAYLRTGTIIKSWRGRTYSNYCVANNGVFLVEATYT